ncbi:hypothetical protein M426DRAFT_14959 [Hypoxylon sp. CI-4A]|nr:hypothetical protein M426DRAFT_14959 [Hypoxylon sp. CI-4A]
MATNASKPKVYRLRGCPGHFDKQDVTKLLSRELGDVASTDIEIQSLATELKPLARSPTKVATLMFYKLPALLEREKGKNEWSIQVLALEEPLLLDTHFLGMTPFNDVESDKHEFDCIALSGLGSHPFGSWQPKGGDKSFMWIRDRLPRYVHNTRAIVYGYDTSLVGSTSFQSIPDLAATFINQIMACWRTVLDAKQLVFLAHSLGGIVVKEAFRILAGRDQRSTHMLGLFRGGVFFGVPSQGMATSHLHAMVKNQPNEQMVQDLSVDSPYLRSLDEQFHGLALQKSMRIHWAYETKTSPTVTTNSEGSFTRTGPKEILVSRESATRSLYSSLSSSNFPIDQNHSDIVKFGNGDQNLGIVMEKLNELCGDGAGDYERDEDAVVPSGRIRLGFALRKTSSWSEAENQQEIEGYLILPQGHYTPHTH